MLFDYEANTVYDAVQYIKRRAIQLMVFGYQLTQLTPCESHVVAHFKKGSKVYVGVYILKDFRGKGLYPKIINELQLPVVTLDECSMEQYLKSHGFPYKIHTLKSKSYELISEHYGDKKATRSSIPLMNHIDEGMAIMTLRGMDYTYDRSLYDAFCLHPLIQSDEDYQTNINRLKEIPEIDGALWFAIKYREYANAYLSFRKVTNLSDIELPAWPYVRIMLVADKIQNRKDFELYNSSHPRAKELAHYFDNWLKRLRISTGTYNKIKNRLMLPVYALKSEQKPVRNYSEAL